MVLQQQLKLFSWKNGEILYVNLPQNLATTLKEVKPGSLCKEIKSIRGKHSKR